MTVREIQPILDATVYCEGASFDAAVKTACGSDMMSDVLAYVKDQSVLLTGLLNSQAVRTAEMMDMLCIVFVRGKCPDESIVRLAQERGIAVMSTRYPMFAACGKLYEKGLKGGRTRMSDAIRLEYEVPGDDFTRAGEASSDVKRLLKKLGVAPGAVRRVAIALYEGEINLAIHGGGGQIVVEVSPEEVSMVLSDHGPGIPNIDLAMQEGWSTAPDSVRNLGFGAGMGLPNMKRNADEMTIESAVGVGTTVRMKVQVG